MESSEQSVILRNGTRGDIFCSCDRTASFTFSLPQTVTEIFCMEKGFKDRERRQHEEKSFVEKKAEKK
jgi:hypothetical protein